MATTYVSILLVRHLVKSFYAHTFRPDKGSNRIISLRNVVDRKPSATQIIKHCSQNPHQYASGCVLKCSSRV